MNFLAHCFLAQPNADSLMGNLLGDFIKGAGLSRHSEAVLRGLKNHQAVDRFTDQHPVLAPLKSVLSQPRRRFSGIIADVVFDHFLSKHWQQFTDQDIEQFIEHCYAEIMSVQDTMHESMRRSMQFMVDDDGLRINRDLTGVACTLNRLSRRIRFENKLHGAIVEVEQHYAAYEKAFLQLFPDLLQHTQQLSIESNRSD